MQFMQNESKLKYNIIIPAHNEEKFIAKTLDSILQQTHLPQEVIVVNDNSDDHTSQIVSEYETQFSFIKQIHSQNTSTLHEPGSKIVQAFYKGFEHLKSDFDCIVKLDADTVLPHNYFEKVMGEFYKNPKIGICGGQAYIQKNNEWIREKMGDHDHIRGPIKTYSKSCFEKIGGLKNSIGWDTVDELLARYYGFEIKVLPELKVLLQKPTGIHYQNIHDFKTGVGFYKMDYGLTISLIAAAKSAYHKKSIKAFTQTLKGYFNASKNADNKIVTTSEGKFIRQYRWQNILKKLINRS